MEVRALESFSFIVPGDYDHTINMDRGDIRTIADLDLAQSFINSGMVEEVVACSSCGSYVKA